MAQPYIFRVNKITVPNPLLPTSWTPFPGIEANRQTGKSALSLFWTPSCPLLDPLLDPLPEVFICLILGHQLESETYQKRHVYIGNLSSNTWEEIQPLNVPRFGHSCGKFTFTNGTEVIIVAGGRTGNTMASKIRHIEILNLQVHFSQGIGSGSIFFQIC